MSGESRVPRVSRGEVSGGDGSGGGGTSTVEGNGEEDSEGDENDGNRKLQGGGVSSKPKRKVFARSGARPLFGEKPARSSSKIFNSAIDGNKSFGKASGNKLFLLYICNIPLKATSIWLVATFSPFGKVIGSYISPRTSEGFVTKFGFVRFGFERDALQAIMGLNGVIVGKWRLIVQVSKRRSFYSETSSVQRLSRSSSGCSRERGLEFSHSCLDLSNRSEVNLGLCAFGRVLSDSGSRKKALGSEEGDNRSLCALVATMRSDKAFGEARYFILKSCREVKSVSLIDSCSVFIIFHSSSSCNFALQCGLWSDWFYSLRLWQDKCSRSLNHVWIECVGISFMAWNNAIFVAIASAWGSLIEVDKETSEMEQVASTRLCVLMPQSAIEEIIYLNVDGSFFTMQVSSNLLPELILERFKGLADRVVLSQKGVGRFEAGSSSSILHVPSMPGNSTLCSGQITKCTSDSAELFTQCNLGEDEAEVHELSPGQGCNEVILSAGGEDTQILCSFPDQFAIPDVVVSQLDHTIPSCSINAPVRSSSPVKSCSSVSSFPAHSHVSSSCSLGIDSNLYGYVSDDALKVLDVDSGSLVCAGNATPLLIDDSKYVLNVMEMSGGLQVVSSNSMTVAGSGTRSSDLSDVVCNVSEACLGNFIV